MTAAVVHANLPWSRGREDWLFSLLNLMVVPLLILLVLWLNQQQTPEFERRELSEVAPGLARLILEKTPPPEKKELEKIAPPVEKPEPRQEPKEIPSTAEPVEPKPLPAKPDKRSLARQKAARSGLLAMRDELADLRDGLDLSHLGATTSGSGDKAGATMTSATDALKKRSLAGSGSIGDANLERGQSQGQLAQRRAYEVSSGVIASAEAAAEAARKAQAAKNLEQVIQGRNREEIERVFQQNKGAIFGIYNRALRSNPMLQGRVVVELTITADGKVTRCVVISSELGDKALEKRLVSRIKRFKFQSRKVEVTTVTYPIDFLPS